MLLCIHFHRNDFSCLICPYILNEYSCLTNTADRGYDTGAMIAQARQQGMAPVIPPKKNSTQQRDYDKVLYKLRHFVEYACLHLKRWRGIATRYAKNSASFLAAVRIGCIDLWGDSS